MDAIRIRGPWWDPTLLAIALVCLGLPGASAGEPEIRVRLARDAKVASFRAFGLEVLGPGGDVLTPSVPGVSERRFRCRSGRVEPAEGGFPSAKAPSSNWPTPREINLRSGASLVSFQGNPHRGVIRVLAKGERCEVIARVPLDDYLDSVVGGEFSPNWSQEALDAQVIAARTYALHRIREARSNPKLAHDLEADTADQVYPGTAAQHRLAAQAVTRTRGLILSPDGSHEPLPIKAFYHSTCGGSTELPENVWGNRQPGFKRLVRCPFCAGSPRITWTLDLDAREIADTIAAGVDAESARGAADSSWLPSPSERRRWRAALASASLQSIDPEGGGGPRSEWVRTRWKTGNGVTAIRVPAARLRDWVGPERFRSTQFTANQQGKTWRIRGRGNGHGVGMCQWGAKTMAERGITSALILRFYYPDARVRKSW